MGIVPDNLKLIGYLAAGLYPQSFTRERVATLRTMNLGEGRNYSKHADAVNAELDALVEKGHLVHDPAEDRSQDRYTATESLLSIFEGKTGIELLIDPIVAQYRFTEPKLTSY